MPTNNWADSFLQHHIDNPKIYIAFRNYAKMAQQAGRKKIGLNSLVERVRWDTMLSDASQQYKISDAYTAYYARMLMWLNPGMRQLFRLKRINLDGLNTDLRDVRTWDQNYWNQFNQFIGL